MDDDEDGTLQPVGRRTRPALWIGAWVVGLTAIALVAVVGRIGDRPGVTAVASVLVASGLASPAPDELPAIGAVPPALTLPTIDSQPLTTSTVIVRGSSPTSFGPLRVSLYSMRGDELAGADLPAESTFLTALRIPEPRPVGPALLRVSRILGDGGTEPLVDRPVVIAPLAPTPATVRRPPLGEDGLVGGLVFGTAWPPPD